MFDWIAGYVARWSAFVGQHERDLVHWAVHALAGVVYTVFGNVGKAWTELFGAFDWIRVHVVDFAGDVYRWIDRIITVDIPYLWHILLSDVKGLLAEIAHALSTALAAVEAALKVALHAVQTAITWVIDHVYAPLKAYADQIWNDLLKWWFTAYDLVTHPDKLAAILLGALIGAAEAAFWTIADPVGRFIFGILLKQSERFVRLLETILTAVL